MIRRLLFDVFLFLLPFAAYALFLRFAPQRKEGEPERAMPWVKLTIAGLLLVAASFVWLGVAGGAGEIGTYIPPHVEDGRVVPGRIEPAPPP